MASILWRRLDMPGHDACRLEGSDAGWCTLEGRVHGWLGAQSVDLAITRTAQGVWTLNGAVVPGLESYVDLDLGFTPATNLPQVRRLALADGQGADVPVAWLDVVAGTLKVLPQNYERRTRATYWYEAPSVGYSGLLEVTTDGFIRRYPGLWEMEH